MIRQAVKDGGIIGYSVLRINRYLKEYSIGYIVDLITPPDRIGVADALIQDAVNYFDRDGINIVNFQMIKNHTYLSVLKKHGFLDGRVKFNLFYRPAGETDVIQGIEMSPPSKLLISWGDHDVLPVGMPSYQ